MPDLVRDLRFALRLGTASPAVSAGLVLSLMLAIAANTTVFSLADALLLRPLPVADPDELVSLHARAADGSGFHAFSYLDVEDLRRIDAFAALAAYSVTPIAWSTGERAEVVLGHVVSGDYFEVLGVRAALGRTFTAGEGRVPGRDAVAVIGHALWTRRFAADPAVLGRSVRLNGHPFTVIGVAPPGFTGPFHGLAGQLWAPLSMRRELHVGEDLALRNHVWLEVLARRAPGIGLGAARAAVDAAHAELDAGLPADWGVAGIDVRPLAPVPAHMAGAIAAFVALLFVLSGSLLAVAAINVAGLLVARAAARRREIAVRLALGCTRRRLARQLLVESLALFALAALVSLAVSALLVAAASGLFASLAGALSLPIELDLRLDHRALGFTALVALAAGVVFGWAPLAQAARPAVLAALQDESGGTPGRRRARLRSVLVAAQLAVSLALLVVAGLLAVSLARGLRVDPGFDPDGVQVLAFDLSRHGYGESDGRELHRRLAERLEALPGVDQVALASVVPLGFERQSTAVAAGGRPGTSGTDLAAVGPGYFRLLGIPLLAGREFSDADTAGGTPVAIVDRRMARHFSPQGDAVGQTLYDGDVATGEPLRVVGVAETVRSRRSSEEPGFFFYRPLAQRYRGEVKVLARIDGPADAVLPALRRAVRGLDERLPLVEPTPLSAVVRSSLLPLEVAAGLAAALGLVALVLTAVGIYALSAFLAEQRVREVGIRAALGAAPREITRLLMRRGMTLTASGAALGLTLGLLAGAGGGWLAWDGAQAAACGALAALLVVVALLASWLPARRMGRLAPLSALRR